MLGVLGVLAHADGGGGVRSRNLFSILFRILTRFNMNSGCAVVGTWSTASVSPSDSKVRSRDSRGSARALLAIFFFFGGVESFCTIKSQFSAIANNGLRPHLHDIPICYGRHFPNRVHFCVRLLGRPHEGTVHDETPSPTICKTTNNTHLSFFEQYAVTTRIPCFTSMATIGKGWDLFISACTDGVEIFAEC